MFAAFAADMKKAQENKTVALIGKRLNYEMSGIRSKVIATGRKVGEIEAGPYKEAVIAIDKIWGEPDTWATIKRSSSAYTPFYLLAMLDMRQGADGSHRAGAGGPRHLHATFSGARLASRCWSPAARWSSAIRWPTCWRPRRSETASILMIFVLLPFWTSLLVRTTAWMILHAGRRRVRAIPQRHRHHLAR